MSKETKLGKIAVVGAGGWGTALSMVLSENFEEVFLWTRNDYLAVEINERRTNERYLPDAEIPLNIYATIEPNAISDIDIIVNAVPTQYIGEYYKKYNIDLSGKKIINSSKGIENGSLDLISEIFADYYDIPKENYAIITGPSHAEEVWKGLPTTVVAASSNIDFAKQAQSIFSTNSFRVYTSDDPIGCEIGGALKNVIAIAAGIIDGMEYGDNTKAALITRGLAEISRLGEAVGANHQTFSGLSGLGDLFVTCDSKHSRNRKFGERIGRGESAEEVLDSLNSVAEGVYTSKSAYELSRKKNIEMPITEQIYQIIYEGKSPEDAIKDLMNRDSKHEWYS